MVRVAESLALVACLAVCGCPAIAAPSVGGQTHLAPVASAEARGSALERQASGSAGTRMEDASEMQPASVALLQAVRAATHSTLETLVPDAKSMDGMQAPWYAFPSTFGLISCVIVFIYGNRGWKVVFSVMMYLTALSSMKLAVKWVFVECAFKYAKFVTVLHFVSGALVCLGVLLVRRWQDGSKIAVPTVSEFFFMITPIALATSFSIGACNMALGFSSVAFTEIVGATTCLFTVATVLLMGLPFDKRLLIPTVAVAMGCGLSTAGEVSFSTLGLVLVFGSNFFRSAKATGGGRAANQACVLWKPFLVPCARS